MLSSAISSLKPVGSCTRHRFFSALVSAKDLPNVPIKYTKLFINNAFIESSDRSTFVTTNPITGDPICEVSSATATDVDSAVSAARSAFADTSPWRRMDASERGRLLSKLADLVERDTELLAQLETLDNGKPIADARAVDVGMAVKVLRYYAGWADKIHGLTIPGDGPHFVYTRREPIGVCGQIFPWNYPLLMQIWKLAPALCAGNVIVQKPAEETPLTALHIAALTQEAGFPDGVVNVLPGIGEVTGASIVAHPHVDKIAFTGSTEVGKLIHKNVADGRLKRCTLELGGKSPNIIFADAPMDVAVEQAHQALFFNHGQTCCAGSRTLVQADIYDEFVCRSVERAKARVVGNPFSSSTEQGPVISEVQMNKILSMVERGASQGAKVACGGERLGSQGFFIQPTVLADVDNKMDVAQQEIFGPVQCIIPFTSVDDAIAIANDSEYGLAAGVFTKDIERAMHVSHRLQAGTVWVNTYNMTMPQAPFGGFKDSGIGRELGPYGIDAYTEVKNVTVSMPTKIS